MSYFREGYYFLKKSKSFYYQGLTFPPSISISVFSAKKNDLLVGRFLLKKSQKKLAVGPTHHPPVLVETTKKKSSKNYYFSLSIKNYFFNTTKNY